MQQTILVMITFPTLLATPAYLSIEKDVEGLRACSVLSQRGFCFFVFFSLVVADLSSQSNTHINTNP